MTDTQCNKLVIVIGQMKLTVHVSVDIRSTTFAGLSHRASKSLNKVVFVNCASRGLICSRNILGCSGVFILVSVLNFKICLHNLISTLLSSVD